MRTLAVVTALCAAAVVPAAVSAAPAASVDSCLVGRWTLIGSVGAGRGAFVGLKMTIRSSGVATLDYAHAHSIDNGGLNATFRGRSTLDLAAHSGRPPVVEVKSEHVSLTERSAFGTAPWNGEDPLFETTSDYTCSTHTLTLKSEGTGGGVLNGTATFHR